MYFVYKWEESGQFADFLLREHFTTKRVSDGDFSIESLQHYVTSIQDSVRKWHAIHFPDRASNLSEEVRRGLERLVRLGRGAFAPFIMAATQKSKSDTQLTDFLAAAERFVFTVSRLCQRRSDTGDSEFYRLAGQLFGGDKLLTEVTASVHGRTNDKFSREKAITEMRDLFQRGVGTGFYGWEGLRYFQFEYEQHLLLR